MSGNVGAGRRLAGAGVGAALVVGVACFGPDTTEAVRARAEIAGPSGEEVEVITSKSFAVNTGTVDTAASRVDLLAADTGRMTLPVEREFDIRSTRRFFIRVGPPEAADGGGGNPLEVTLRVFIDDRRRFDQTADLRRRPLRFVFVSSRGF